MIPKPCNTLRQLPGRLKYRLCPLGFPPKIITHCHCESSLIRCLFQIKRDGKLKVHENIQFSTSGYDATTTEETNSVMGNNASDDRQKIRSRAGFQSVPSVGFST